MTNGNPKETLWKALVDGNYYSKSFQEFENQFSNDETIGVLHKALVDGNYYSKSLEEFKGQFFFSETEVSSQGSPTPSEPSEPSGQEDRFIPYGLDKHKVSEVGRANWSRPTSSLYPTNKDSLDVIEDQRKIAEDANEKATQRKQMLKEQKTLEQPSISDLRAVDVSMPTEQRVSTPTPPPLQTEKERYARKLLKENIEFLPEELRKQWQKYKMDTFEKTQTYEEKQSSNKRTLSDPTFLSEIGLITPDLIGKEEEEVVPFLSKTFSKYWFNFKKSGVGDAMIVSTLDGSKSIDIDLDPFTGQGERDNALSLSNFIRENAQ